MEPNKAMLDCTREYLIVLSKGLEVQVAQESVGPNQAKIVSVTAPAGQQIIPREGPANVDGVERKAVFFVAIPDENIPLP